MKTKLESLEGVSQVSKTKRSGCLLISADGSSSNCKYFFFKNATYKGAVAAQELKTTHIRRP